MATKKKVYQHRRPISSVITLPDPDNYEVAGHAEVGGFIEWRCDTPNYPDFDIVFIYSNPFNDIPEGFTVSGSISKPVVLEVVNANEYEYKVRHYPKGGGASTDSETKFGHTVPCKNCPTGG